MKRKSPFSLLLLMPLLIITSYNSAPEKAFDPLIQRFKQYQEALPVEKAYLHVDRPFYKPGDDIWFSAFLVDGTSHRASGISGIMYVQLINPKGNVEKELRLIARNGRASGDFHLSPSVPGGVYKLKAYTRWMKNQGEESYFEKEIQVQAVVYPKLLMKLDFEKKAYGAGDEVRAKLEVRTLTKSPLAIHPVRFSVKLQGQEFISREAKTNEEGVVILNFRLPDSLRSADALLNIKAEHEGKKESFSRSVPVILNNISLQFFPEGGDMAAGIEGRVAFKALNEWGKPADVEGDIFDERNIKVADFSSFHDGMGAFKLKPERGMDYRVVITKPAGIKTFFYLPKAKEQLFALSAETDKDRIQLGLYAPEGEYAKVVAQSRGEILYTKKLNPEKGMNQLTIPTDGFPAGVVQITLFDSQNRARCERLVFVSQHKSLTVEITTDKEKYLPREQVNMRIKVKDDKGKAVPATLSLAVVDDKVLSFADDRQDNILSYLLLSSEVKGKVEEPSFYFDPEEPKAARALDYLLMTQGWRRFSGEDMMEGLENGSGRFLHAPEKAVLKGRVLNYWAEDPVANVKVSVKETGEVTHTDAEGKFIFNSLNLCTPRTLQAEINGQRQRIKVSRYAQEYIMSDQVSGKITDSGGNPLPGAVVMWKGTDKGTTTDSEGRFAINPLQNNKVLVISLSGYSLKEVSPEGRNYVNIDLKQANWDWPESRSTATEKNALFQESPLQPDRQPEVTELLQEEMVPLPISEESPVPPLSQQAEIITVPDEEETEKDIFADEADITDLEVMEETVLEDIFFEFEQAPAESEDADKIFEVVEQQPYPIGGMDAFYKLVGKKLRYPKEAYEKGIEGRVYVRFVVDEKGNVAYVKTVKGLGFGLDEAAEKVIARSKWIPGKQRGRSVSVRMVMPIVFKMGGFGKANVVNVIDELEFVVAHQDSFGPQEKESFYYCGREFYMPPYQPDEKPEERTDFRKTIYWNPDVQIGASGEALVSFFTTDEITSFKTVAEGMGIEGCVARGTHTLYTQLPFYLEGSLPPVLTYEDKVSVPVRLKNNTAKQISGTLEVTLTEHIRLLQNNQQIVSLKAGEGKTIYLKGEVQQKPGMGEMKVSFKGQGFEDAFVQFVEVVPKGFPMAVSFAAKSLNSSYSFNLDKAVPNSLHATLTAYPDLLTDLMQGVESILREPHGCFEQASSATYPNILALQYLKEANQTNFEVKKKALDLIQKGYQRLISFETAEKGYEWFGAVPPHEGLTAYGLMEFADMQKVYASVDHKMMDRTTSWLLSRRDGKGSFSKGFQKYAFGRAKQEVSDAYITYALSEVRKDDLKAEWMNVYREVLQSGDAYRLGLVTNTAFSLGRQEEGEKLLQIISRLLKENSYGNLPADHSFTYSQGKSLQTETAALLVMAYLKNPEKYHQQIREGVDYLVESRSGNGGFGSTQATILALKALTAYAKFSKKTAEDGIIEVYVNGQKAGEQAYEKDQKGEIQLSGLEKFISEGESDISVRFKDTKEAIPYSLGIYWTGYTPPSDPVCKVAIDVALKQNKIKAGETSRLEIRIKNTTSEGLPMVVARIGIPSGVSVQPWQLKELTDKKVFDFYEISKNYLVLYYRGMAPDAVKEIFLDLKSELPGTYEAVASSAYLYYTNEYKDWKSGSKIEIME